MTNRLLTIIFLILTSCGSKTSADYSSTKTMTEDQITNNVLFIRTDFTNEEVWKNVLKQITTPSADLGFISYVNPINDPTNQGKTTEQIIADLPKDYYHTFILVFDSTTVTHKDNIILCVDISEKSHRSFRVKPKDLWTVENNLSIANMDFEEFANSVDSANIFTGF